MDQCSIRVFALNILTLMISFTNLEAILKVVLLLISIIYTSMKIFDWVSNKRKGKIQDKEE
jgi:hypothetical protein